MAIIKPFQAIRPTRDKAALATSRSYEAYSKKELRSQLTFNPYSFLHIIKPGYGDNTKTSEEERFKRIRATYTNFKHQNIYQKDAQPCFYLHHKTYKQDLFWGIIGIAHTGDYQNNVIKKHEDTLEERESLFANYLETVGFNAEPVLLTYPENEYLNRLNNLYAQQRSEYEFMTRTGRLHKLWVINDPTDIAMIEREFGKMRALYIADGHHRCASSNYLASRLKAKNKAHSGTENYNYFMSYLIADSNLKISEYNRFVKDLNGLTKEVLLNKIKEYFIVEKLSLTKFKPRKKHQFSMYIEGTFYKLSLRDTTYKIKNALADLDTRILHETILKPLLGIDDLKTNDRISCKAAIYSKNQLKKEVDSGKYKVSFGLFPVSFEQLKAVVNEDLKMPPKSTYIEPKLRSGLTIFEIID